MPIEYGMSGEEAAKTLKEMAESGEWTTGMLRGYLNRLKKEKPEFAWVDVDLYVRGWALAYGFPEGPDKNEFGDVCP